MNLLLSIYCKLIQFILKMDIKAKLKSIIDLYKGKGETSEVAFEAENEVVNSEETNTVVESTETNVEETNVEVTNSEVVNEEVVEATEEQAFEAVTIEMYNALQEQMTSLLSRIETLEANLASMAQAEIEMQEQFSAKLEEVKKAPAAKEIKKVQFESERNIAPGAAKLLKKLNK